MHMILYEQQQVSKYWVGDVEGGHKLLNVRIQLQKFQLNRIFAGSS